eukprot:4836680-Alexandrium_andersonii.AAC.1
MFRALRSSSQKAVGRPCWAWLKGFSRPSPLASLVSASLGGASAWPRTARRTLGPRPGPPPSGLSAARMGQLRL